MTQLIILDRDGVINEDSDAFIKSPQEWIAIPGSLEAIARLTRARYHVIVATNQSGLARGLFDMVMLNRIHEKMHSEVGAAGGRLDAVFFCPHGPDDDCNCRKPKPGLFHDISKRLQVELNGKPAVGDSLRDLQAARDVGAKPILVRTGKGRATEQRQEGLEGVDIYDNLYEAVKGLLTA